MASAYKIGTISEILANESGGGKKKTDPNLVALFANGAPSSTSTKVFRTVKVNENHIFRKKVTSVSGVADIGSTADKVAKKKKDKLKDKAKLKNKDAAGIRVNAKEKVKTGINGDVTEKIKGSSSKLNKQEKKKKKNKIKLKKQQDVQDEIISSTTKVTEDQSVDDASLAKKTEKKKKNKKSKKRSLESNDNLEDESVKKVKLEDGTGAQTKKAKKKKSKKLKGLKQANAIKKIESDEGEDVTMKAEVVEESDNESHSEEEGDTENAKSAEASGFKTLAERNAPKAKDPELEARTLFIGNLPGDVDKKVLHKMFKSFGKIETVRLRGGAPNKPTQLKKVAINKKELHADKNTITGYIRFTTREGAENAVEKGRGLMVKENHLVLDLADQGKKRDNKLAIFVGNLNMKITDEELWRFFEDCGTIQSVRVIRDNATGLGKGFGYVNFEDKDAVEKALQKNQQELRSRSVRISRCVKKLKVKKTPGASKFSGGGKDKGDDSKMGKPWKKDKKPRPTKVDSQDYGGDRLAEIGKLKRKSNKPNRGELRKAKIARLLTQTGKPSTVVGQSSKTVNSRQASINPNARNKKRYFN